MKSKKATYLLGFVVLVVWGLIIYRIFAAAGGDDDQPTVAAAPVKKESYNDYAVPKDTSRLLLNYRDPFGLVKVKDTAEMPVKRILRQSVQKPAPPAMNWGFIQYSGYIRNPGTKKLIALVIINGKNEQLSEGENRDQVKLIKNMRDSIKISYNGKIKFIAMKSAAL